MTMRLFAALLAAGCLAANSAEAQLRFPRVYGATGRPYGPTQAHYQYQRQYGRPWHGYGGYTAAAPSGVVFSGGLSWWGGYPAIVAPPPVVAYAPGLSFYSPGVIGGFGYYGTPGAYWPYADPSLVQPPFASSPLEDAWLDNLDRWGPSLPPAKPDPITLPVAPSTPEAQLRSLRAQQQGDEHLRQQQWLSAYVDYKRAVEVAPDRAEAHLRLGLVHAMLQNYDSAIFSLKRALALDPALPQSGIALATIFGHGSDIPRSAMLHRVADYVEADVRSPDRLFLFGCLLHFSGDARATEVFEAGYRLAGRGSHFLAFLKPDAVSKKSAENAAGSAPKETTLPPAPLPSAPDFVPPASPSSPPSPLPPTTAPTTPARNGPLLPPPA
jgi:tetratricopeptide (TPR) repeat protein